MIPSEEDWIAFLREGAQRRATPARIAFPDDLLARSIQAVRRYLEAGTDEEVRFVTQVVERVLNEGLPQRVLELVDLIRHLDHQKDQALQESRFDEAAQLREEAIKVRIELERLMEEWGVSWPLTVTEEHVRAVLSDRTGLSPRSLDVA